MCSTHSAVKYPSFGIVFFWFLADRTYRCITAISWQLTIVPFIPPCVSTFFFLWTYFIYWCSKQCTITNNNKIQKEKEKKSRCFHFLLIIKSKKRQADTTLLIIMKKKASLKIQKKKKIKLRPVNLVFLYSGTFGKFFIAFFPYHIF